MISLKIIDIKAFMNSLLRQNIFDNFLLSELDIITYNHFHITGLLNENFYSNDELEVLGGRKYSLWSDIKPIAFTLIKGNKLPLSIKIVFLLSPIHTEKIIQKAALSMKSEEINGLFLNIRFEKGYLYLITGTSLKTFTLDKSLEQLWDSEVRGFLKRYEIAAEEA